MSRLDRLYRAFREYRKELSDDRETAALRSAAAESAHSDRICAVRFVCTIENDWVDAIENGLVFIGKAIDEERQFIRSEGEISPIEKVKHVSRESVEHLARHSNFITHAAKEGEDLVPEKLYTVERLNNYAVYENRFLYMVLCRLSDFVSVRHDRIIKLSNTYQGESFLQRKINYGKISMEYTFTLQERREDDPFLRKHNRQRETLERLERIRRAICYYLRTPLMVEVAKADKLKPPVVKTNVLRMDKNFKEVVALYDFICAYDRDGYTVEREERKVDHARQEIAEQFADPALMLSFLTYEHGLGIEEILKEEFEREEQRRREAEQLRLREQLENMRRRIAEGGGSPEEYIRLLEKNIRELERDKETLLQIKEQAEALELENGALRETIAAHGAELEALAEQHSKEKELLNEEKEELSCRMAEQAAAYADEIVRINRACDKVVQEERGMLAQKEREYSELREKAESTERERALAVARLTAMRAEHGLIGETENYTSEAAFLELEHQYKVFGDLLRREWRGAKRVLRKDFFQKVKGFYAQKWREGFFRSGKAAVKDPDVQPETEQEKEEKALISEDTSKDMSIGDSGND